MSKRQVLFGGATIAILITLAIASLGGGVLFDRQMTFDDGVSQLSKKMKKVNLTENYVTRVAQIELSQKFDLEDILPDIREYPMVVDPRLGPNDVAVEIFVTTIRSGKGTDGLDIDIAKAFNQADIRLSNGKFAKVKVRKVASGTGYQFIASRKYMPDAFSPVHQLWIEMARANGIPMTSIRDRTVSSVGGVVMRTGMADALRQKYGNVGIKSIITGVAQGDLAMGYTNPFASSTGLNFLLTVLSTFAEGNEADMLSPSVVSAFEQFQRGVPFVALTTVHMRDSVRDDGSLDAFILGHQTFSRTEELQSGFEFFPFGIRHDHPLYAVGNLPAEKLEVLEQYALFSERPRFQKLAKRYGWNASIDFTPTVTAPSGETLIRAQRLWKEKKNAGARISAVFLTDVSGSMQGGKLRAVKESLIAGSNLISPENSIGLAVFSDKVQLVLPIRPFKLQHKGAFHAAVQEMRASGGTAMYDGIAAALTMLLEERARNPGARLMLFVLTDGETAQGMRFDDILPIIRALKIPIYTIGYDADIKTLKKLSSIVEAASINANEGQIGYKIGSMLNAQM